MNKTYSTVWSETRQCYVAVGENTRRAGKSGSTVKTLVEAVAVACLALGSAQALAIPLPPTCGLSNSVDTGIYITSTCVLQDGAALSVAAGGSIIANSSAVEVDTVTLPAGNIINAGTLSGGTATNSGSVSSLVSSGIYVIDTLGYGITSSGLISGGNVTNTSTISGVLVNAGIYVGGTVTGGITNSNIISGGNVTNTGTIGTIIDAGIYVTGTVSGITNSSIISGGYVTNSGTVTGNAGVAGIYVNGGSISGGIANNNGTISSGSLVNNGYISGDTGAAGIFVQNSGIAGSIANNGTLSVIMGGDVGVFVSGSTVASGITNAGSISGGYAGIYIDNTSVSGGIAGGIHNTGTASSIIGGQYGIYANNTSISGGINNEGMISGGKTAIYANASTLSEGIHNSGLIDGAEGIYAYQSTISGGITNNALSTISGVTYNSGTVSGGTGISVSYSSISGGIHNEGTISGVSYNNGTITGGTGISATYSTISGGITNSGLIAGTERGITAFYSTISGGIVNQSTGTISGGIHGLDVAYGSLIDSINNAGRIEGGLSSGSGIRLYSNSSISGGITNSGTISGGNVGIQVDATSSISSGITNSGLIHGGDKGIFVDSSSNISGGIHNAATGTISGGYTGIQVNSSSSISSGITNSGLIYGGNKGISVDSSSNISGGIHNAATGTISGGYTGIQVGSSSNISSGITNSGLIHGGNNGIAVVGSSSESYRPASIYGGIHNTGMISGTEGTGILASYADISGGIHNTNGGSISGGYAGIEINNSTLSLGEDGAGINNGTASSIIGGQYGIHAHNSTINNGINNSGIISGATGTGILVDSYSTVSGGIQNTGGGSISGGYAGIEINRSTFVYDGAEGINNTGTASSIIGGQFGISITNATIDGYYGPSIYNEGIIASNHTGIYVSNSSLPGGITNNGVIYGADQSINATSSISGGVYNGNGGKLIGGLYLGGGTSLYNDGELVLKNNVDLANIANTGGVASGTISGNYYQGEDGLLHIAALHNNTGTLTGGYSQLYVGGTATIVNGNGVGNGIYVDVKTNNSLITGQVLTNVVSSSFLNGTISGMQVHDNSYLLNFTAAGTTGEDGHIDLNVLRDPTAPSLINGDDPASGAAGAFDSIMGTDLSGNPGMAGVIATLQAFSTQQEVNDAIKQTLPLLTGGMAQATNSALHGVNRVVQARQEGNHGRSSGDQFYGDKQFWLKPFGSWASQDDRKGVTGYDAKTWGMVLGTDGTFSKADRIGAAFAYSRSNVDGNASVARQTADVTSYQFVLYGTHDLSDTTDFHYQADIGRHSNEGQRHITAFGPATTAKADYDSWSYHLGAGLAHTYKLSAKSDFTTSVRADYAAIKDDAYDESSATPAALNLKVQGHTADEFIVSVDGKLAHALTDTSKLTANLGVGYDLINQQASITAAFAGAPSASFTTKGLDQSPWLVRGGLGIIGKINPTTEVTARYDFEKREDFNNQTLSVKGRWSF